MLRRINVFVLLAVFMSLSAVADAQVSFTGNSASEQFGSQPIGASSSALMLSFSIKAGTVVGSVAVVTTGIANLDFNIAPGTTCTAQSYASATSCIVSVTFTPHAAGMRMGEVVFYSAAGNKGTVLASTPVYGNGLGPQIAFGVGVSAAVTARVNGVVLENPNGVAVDAAGDLFILDADTNPNVYRVVKAPPGGTAVNLNATVNGEGLYLPSCIAVDGAGNVYVGEFYGIVVEIPANGSPATSISPTVNGIPLNYPSGIALDGAGDLFIGDSMNNRIVEIPASGAAAIAIDPTVNGIPLNDPHGMALDFAGNLYIADLGNDRVVMLPAGGGAPLAIDPIVDGVSLANPESVAVDGAGDLFIADNVNDRVVEVQAGGGPATAFSPALYTAGLGVVSAVTVDSVGDVFSVESGVEGSRNVVEEVQRSQPPALSFPMLTAVDSIDTIDGIQTVQILNVGNQPLTIKGLNYPADFSAASGDGNTCTVTTSLGAGQQCDLPIQFTPQANGALNENLTLTDNASNIAGSQQIIPLSGTAQVQGLITSPVAGSILPGPSVPFTWSSGTSVTWYYLSVGSNGVGSTDLYNSGRKTATSWTATGLPVNGETLFVRLATNFNGVQLNADYTYTAATQAAMVSPAPGALLPGPKATFTWSAGTGGTAYYLWLGSTAPGSNNLGSTGQSKATSATFTNLPTNGETIFVRLFTNFNGVQTHLDYTYTSAAQAVITSPLSGAVLDGPDVTFTGAAASGAGVSTLVVGTVGPGSSDLYNSGQTTVPSATATGLPTNGEFIYARVYTNFNGVQVYTDYTYRAAKQAAMMFPAPGSNIRGTSVTFRWNGGGGAAGYSLSLGTNGVGSNNIFNSGEKTATSINVNHLPIGGITIYARLTTYFNNSETYTDYVYNGIPGKAGGLRAPLRPMRPSSAQVMR